MREEVLALFFEGKISGKELANDLEGSEERVSAIASITRIEDMQREFAVNEEMAISLCNSVLSGELEPRDLGTIGFALMASDKFSWDSESVLGDVISDWSCPEINYPLTIEDIRRFRAWLMGAELYPSKPKPAKIEHDARLISVRHKNRLDR